MLGKLAKKLPTITVTNLLVTEAVKLNNYT